MFNADRSRNSYTESPLKDNGPPQRIPSSGLARSSSQAKEDPWAYDIPQKQLSKDYGIRVRLDSEGTLSSPSTGVIEFLAQKSLREGGLSLSRSVDDISASTEFLYAFFPTIVAVLYSILWNWVDLDVKRMQPWLELSKDGGVPALEALNLDYPYGFIALVPFKATKRGHWAMPSGFVASTQLLAIQNQSAALDGSVLQRMYAVKYLSQPYPAFTTPDYALVPFELASGGFPDEANWTSTTTKVWTDIKCWPAQFVQDEQPAYQAYYHFLNGQGCNASSIETVANLAKPLYRMQYLGWHNSAYAEQSLSRSTCPKQFSHQFLASMSQGPVKSPGSPPCFVSRATGSKGPRDRVYRHVLPA
ncbi:unnamed protein product [Parascedosporium putredinis]|uniref:Uncharacterized protein n=1 Tax=Parascedosporium putredinis TaxID=1442378 RepID=A0A9P1GTP1_9PEZI|nr:unnamed protein product [Parascedosporium putredinis]CAI7987439.1 unnamed protein product [Parascedosporium putredinis]